MDKFNGGENLGEGRGVIVLFSFRNFFVTKLSIVLFVIAFFLKKIPLIMYRVTLLLIPYKTYLDEGTICLS